VRLVDGQGWKSPIGLVAFLHPKSLHGVSVELRQADAPGARPIGRPRPCGSGEVGESSPPV
jgi:hypothetical protein